MGKKKLYILSTYTGTTLAYLIRRITKVPYPHVSFALDEHLEEVYSFGRLHSSNPIFAGFVREYIDNGLYKKRSNTMCRVCSVEVDDTEYEAIIDKLNMFIKDGKKYKYDAAALIKLLYKEPKQCDKRYVCSQFVAYLFEQGGVRLFDKSYNVVTPLDFYNLNNVNVEYEGLLSEYRDIRAQDDGICLSIC